MIEHVLRAFGSQGRRVLLLAFAIVLTAVCAACAPVQPSETDAAETVHGQGRLWLVEKEGFAPSYVFGTFHSSAEVLRDLPAAVQDAFDSADSAAFELDDSLQDTNAMAMAMLLPPGRRLEDVLGAELFRRLAESVSGAGVPAAGMQILKPWALIAFLAYPPEELRRQSLGEPVLDVWLQSEARRQGKSVYGLESHEEQLALFDNMSEGDQVAMVADMVNEHHRVTEQFAMMLRAYRDGDLATVMAEVNDLSRVSDVEASLRFRKRLLEDRNHLMVERLQPLLRNAATFVAVGAAHLPGEEGILRLLEQRGFFVTRIL